MTTGEFTENNMMQASDAPEELTAVHVSADLVNDYFRKIATYPLLSRDEVALASQSIEVGLLARERLEQQAEILTPQEIRELKFLESQGSTAYETMTNANLRLVVKIAAQYQNRGLSLMDLIQEGNFGLMHAIEKFDHTLGYAFSTYASNWIKQSIRRSLADKGREIRVPVHTYENMRRVLSVQRSLELEFGRMPSDEEVAAEVDLPVAKVIELYAISRPVVSLNTPLSADDSAVEIGDLLFDDTETPVGDVTDTMYLSEDIEQLMASLPHDQAYIIRRRFGIGEDEAIDNGTIAAELNTTPVRVQQAMVRALRKLRKIHGEDTDLLEYIR